MGEIQIDTGIKKDVNRERWEEREGQTKRGSDEKKEKWGEREKERDKER